MNTTHRLCSVADRRGCEELIRDAFWDLYRPGCVEHLIAHQAWESPDLALALLAEDDQLQGCLIATRAEVVGPRGRTAVLYLGPLAVRPGQQRQGIGSAVMRHALAAGAGAGYPAAFLYGDPGFYSRFGFVNAAQLQVTTPEGANFDAFMGVELSPGSWRGGPGSLIESEVFGVADATLDAFEATFEPRHKHRRPGQLGS